MAQTVEFSPATMLKSFQGLQETSKNFPLPVSWRYIPKHMTAAQFFPGTRLSSSARETCRDWGGEWQLKSCKIHLLNCDKSQGTICSKNIFSCKNCWQNFDWATHNQCNVPSRTQDPKQQTLQGRDKSIWHVLGNTPWRKELLAELTKSGSLDYFISHVYFTSDVRVESRLWYKIVFSLRWKLSKAPTCK